ncbi:MAG: SH3 domain-containing protein, partial [Verrucomicrobiota bacterium]|nr:SH3 domain-containing protein [Verrucomicrobiota bacterium]
GLPIAASVVALLVFAAAVYALYALETGADGRSLAIITAPKIEARLATADSSGTVLVLPAGSEVKILSTRGDWSYAALPNDLRGWIPANSAERVHL